MKKNQQETRKEARKGKEPLLDLHNEIKIITSSNEVFKLWKELIIKYSLGELLDIDVDPMAKMRLNPWWSPYKKEYSTRNSSSGWGIATRRTTRSFASTSSHARERSISLGIQRSPSSKPPRCSTTTIAPKSGWNIGRGRPSLSEN